jgi:hypothetical protein
MNQDEFKKQIFDVVKIISAATYQEEFWLKKK